ncbi:MAG: DUF3727 domain-containing protein [Cyanobacteria bacterium QS_8_64_29]|nr:MAG: DUF3727 domain-containing protein [Cyanobacteria bacterium QS_8_64_29]
MTDATPSSANGQSDTAATVLLDEAGRSLPCRIERTFELDGETYSLLLPEDTPVSLVMWEGSDEAAEAILLEADEAIDAVFADAQAVLAEQDLTLKRTAYTLTVAGELPEAEERDILVVEFDAEADAEEGETEESEESEEFQVLTSFYHQGTEYAVCVPLDPLLLFAQRTPEGGWHVLSPEAFERVRPYIEDQLFDELE